MSDFDTSSTIGLVAQVGNSFEYDPDGQFESLAAGTQTTDAFSYTVSDGNSGTDVGTVEITINGENDAPVFASSPPTVGVEGQAYDYSIAVSDVDTGAVTAIDGTFPDWLSLNDNGDGAASLTGTPASTDVADHPITLIATDDLEAEAEQSSTITVRPDALFNDGFEG